MHRQNFVTGNLVKLKWRIVRNVFRRSCEDVRFRQEYVLHKSKQDILPTPARVPVRVPQSLERPPLTGSQCMAKDSLYKVRSVRISEQQAYNFKVLKFKPL